jgi:hypothetical protein
MTEYNMIDRAKRKTLKRVGALSAAASLSGVVHAAGLRSDAASPGEVLFDDTELGSFSLRTRVSAQTNDIEIVLTNTGDRAATITQMTPHTVTTRRGQFVLGDVLGDDGRLSIDAGQSVSVAMQRHPVVLDASDISHRAASLSQTLRQSASIVVDGKSFAPVTVVPHSPFA